MPSLVLVVEDGTGKADANSYASLAEGDAYHLAHLYVDAWENADGNEKNMALAMATRMLDAVVLWNGVRKTQDQGLGWPRLYAPEAAGPIFGYNALVFWGLGYRYYDSASVPKGVKDATCELARELLKSDRTADPDTQGIKSATVGPISVEFDASDRPTLLPKMVRLTLRPFGTFLTSRGRYRTVRRV